MRVVIVGAGLGGLACAIACRREELEVVVLERADEIASIGAGIQVPPNGTRVARQLGYLDKLLQCGVALEALELRRYANGKTLYRRTIKDRDARYGDFWIVIHRADYHDVLWRTCKELGVDLRLNKEVKSIDFEKNTVMLEDGDVVGADVLIGADGLYSTCRDVLLGSPSSLVETGELAYRSTLALDSLKALNDPLVDELCIRKQVTIWLGPGKHAVFYPVRGGQEFNLVLSSPDDLGHGMRRVDGKIEEMRENYKGWDETLTRLIHLIPTIQKWKLYIHPELETWTKGCFALLGDACHPTLPYQAQGAAMAVEDGAVLGKLLGSLKASTGDDMKQLIPEILKLYESLRKPRTTTNVTGAKTNQKWYQVPDGPEQEARDAELAGVELSQGLAPTGWRWLRGDYQAELLGRDSVAEAVEAFKGWKQKKEAGLVDAA
ncbi:salicylate hydroxylase [Colletotrichum incanum]|uniref:Salicylate hydroxylase n=1 Tax=Colletotrichum incanum TaxID=1573173 RepID=A0A162PKG0_COLIC|nr:salicylate hydroxylase [Colletotrichum incanum]